VRLCHRQAFGSKVDREVREEIEGYIELGFSP
jgi:hypothetical protein